MLLVVVVGAHDQEAGAVLDPVHVEDRLHDLLLHLVGAGRHGLAKVADLHRGDVRLEDELCNIGARGVALLQLLVDVFDLRGAPVVFVDLFLDRQHAAAGLQEPAVMHPQRLAAQGVCDHVVVLRIAVLGIVHVLFELDRRVQAVGPVDDDQAPEATGDQGVEVERLVQHVFLAFDDHDRCSAAVEARPAHHVGDFLLDVVLGFELRDLVELVLFDLGGNGVPGPGHVLARQVDDPFGQPVFTVHDRQQFKVPGDRVALVIVRLFELVRLSQVGQAIDKAVERAHRRGSLVSLHRLGLGCGGPGPAALLGHSASLSFFVRISLYPGSGRRSLRCQARRRAVPLSCSP